jgi:predicted nucleic acid-binding protein
MRIAVDLNVLLDVAQNRVPHYQASEGVLARARVGEFEAVISGHAVTTLFYIIAKFAGVAAANQTVDGLLSDFTILGPDKPILLRARGLPLSDFEDAVVASVAEAARCDYLVTRNVPDFSGSPVPAITPTDLLALVPRVVPPGGHQQQDNP